MVVYFFVIVFYYNIMSTKKKKNFVNFIFLKKVIIFDSFFKPALTNLFIIFGAEKGIIFFLFFTPVITYFNFNRNEDYKKLFPLFDKTLPATNLPYRQLHWDTFQKSQIFPIIKTDSHTNETNKSLEVDLFNSTITNIEYWGNSLTMEFTKKWDYYKKQHFFGVTNAIIDPLPLGELSDIGYTQTKPIFVSARDNLESRFYSCLLNSGNENINKLQKKFYNVDEFALKLQAITDLQADTSFRKHQLILPIVENDNSTFLNLEKSQNNLKNNSFFKDYSIELKPLSTALKCFSAAKHDNYLNQPFINESNIANSFQTELFLKEANTNKNIISIQANIQNPFFESGYFHTQQISEELKQNVQLVIKPILTTKWACIAVDQLLTILNSFSNFNLDKTEIITTTGLDFSTQDRGRNTDNTRNEENDKLKLSLPRQMSGFQFPDMSINEFLEFERRNNYWWQNAYLHLFSDFQRRSKIQIFFGEHFMFPTYYKDFKVDPLPLKLKYYTGTFEGEDNQIKYTGPTVFPISEKELMQVENNFIPLPDSTSSQITVDSILDRDEQEIVSKLDDTNNTQVENLFEENLVNNFFNLNINLTSNLAISQIENELTDTPILTESIETSAIDASNWLEVKTNLGDIFNKNDPRQCQASKQIFFEPLHTNWNWNTILKTEENQSPQTFLNAQKDKFNIEFITDQNIGSEIEVNLVSSPMRYKYNFVVPYINTSTWDLWVANSEEFPISLFPLRQISSLRNSQIDHSFDNIDYQTPIKTMESISNQANVSLSRLKSPKQVDFYANVDKDQYWLMNRVKPVQIDYYEFPLSQSSFSNELIRKHIANISYLKSLNQYNSANEQLQANGLFKIENQFRNVDFNLTKKQIWEPLNTDSWLIVSKFLFAIFIFLILRQLTKSYGQELIAYLIEFISALGIVDDSFKDEFNSDEVKYRIIRDPNIGFRNMAGIHQIIAQLAELVWFLRSSKSIRNLETMLPKGILLVGPPGTGKTLLVKSIAGEAQIPIFLQPAGSFTNASVQGLGAQRLQRLFEKANEYAPCIIFFDEIDSIGKRRSHIIQDSHNECFFKFVTTSIRPVNIKPLSNPVELESEELIEDFYSEEETTEWSSCLTSDSVKPNLQSEADSESLSLLMQLLIELDGLQSSRQVFVMAATNRVDVLDPALVRPGRFDKVLKLGLPKKIKRIQICQLYAKILGIESAISWDYVGRKTIGLSGADLASIMNQSAIDAILQDSKHTTRTIDIAIDKVISDNSQLLDKRCNRNLNLNLHELSSNLDSTLISRLAYYEVGKVFVTILFPQLETSISCSLNSQKPNSRYQKVLNTFLSAQFLRADYPQLKAHIMSLLGGHISQSLYFRKGLVPSFSHSNFAQSDFGDADLTQASNLIYQIIDQWYLDSNHFCFEKLFYFETTQNKIELQTKKLMDILSNILEKQLEKQTSQDKFSSRLCDYNFHNWGGKANWQIQVSEQSANGVSRSTSYYSNWYRIHLKNPNEAINNDEWTLPDMYYHVDQMFFLTKTIGLTELTIQKRDLLYRNLLEFCVQEASILFSRNCAFIDFLASLVIKYQNLQQLDMQQYYNQFYLK